MHKTTCFLLFTTYLLHAGASNQYLLFCPTPDIPDYYWREYKGIIPFDAVPGGVDKDGSTTYIGQAMVYPYGQLPASIYQGNSTAVASAARLIFYAKKNIKILCSQSLDKFRWIRTDNENIDLITNCQLVLGGVDNDHQENIGRTSFNKEVILGKVIRKPLGHDGLWIPSDGTEVRILEFEVLAYGCKN